MSTPDPIKAAWQSSVTEASLPPIEKLRAGADLFYRRVRCRNRIEYAACTLIVLCFGTYVFWLPMLTSRIGAALVVAGTLIAACQLHRRAAAVPPPEHAAGASSILAHGRAQLVRQRDFLAGIFHWYMLPFLPGLLVMLFAPLIEGRSAIPGQNPHGAWIAIAVTTIVFGFIWWLNRVGARKLQRHIDDIDALRGKTE